MPVLEARVVAVLVAALESLPELVVVVALIHVHPGVAVVRVLVGVRSTTTVRVEETGVYSIDITYASNGGGRFELSVDGTGLEPATSDVTGRRSNQGVSDGGREPFVMRDAGGVPRGRRGAPRHDRDD